MKSITLTEAITKGFNPSIYDNRNMNETIQQLKKFEPFCEIVPRVTTYTTEGIEYFEHIIVYLKYKGTLLKPYKKYNENSYTFYLFKTLPVQDFNHDLKTPSKIGKPTDKKLWTWVEYLQNIEVLKSDVLAQRNNKETEFFNKIKDAGLIIQNQSKDGKRGYIIKDNFEFHFEVSNGYISQSIRLTCSNTLENFIKL